MENHLIIIADDDDDDRNMMADALETIFKSPGLIVQVPNGKDLIDLLSRNVFYPALIIIDVMMPFIGGVDLFRKLRTFEQLSEVPIVIFSSDKFNLDNAYQAGADAFYSKPSKIEGFMEVASDIQRLFFAGPRQDKSHIG